MMAASIRRIRSKWRQLQAATSSKRPVLLQVGGSGHGIGDSLSTAINKQADVYAFLFEQLGIKYKPLESKK